MKILVVDDIDYIRKSIAKILADQGHECVCCENGAVAITALQNNQFDLIITDIMMPETDGFEFIDYIHANINPTKQTPIIAISGGSRALNSDLTLRIIQEKTSAVIQKPFGKQDLLDKVASVI